MTPEDIARIRVIYGSDPVQYIQSLLAALSGDFGYSVQSGVPVTQEIATNLPPTFLLVRLGLLAAPGRAFVLARGRFWGLGLRGDVGLERCQR